jgi:large subunit ribosomal protein L23
MPKALNPQSVLVRPLITEKATRLHGENKYAFEVQKHANKTQIKEAVETSFPQKVRVTNVNVMVMKGKPYRVRGNRVKHAGDWKKAVVTLHPDDKLELFEGM